METKDIFECADHREFLRSYLAERKPNNGVRALALAEKALALPLAERDFGGLTVALPPRFLPLVREKIRALDLGAGEMVPEGNDWYHIGAPPNGGAFFWPFWRIRGRLFR